jgi:glycosyltransferase involved in cell wall biosynthesis
MDALFTNGSALKQIPMRLRFRLPTLVWITDFQHLHLPDMFTRQEVDKRNKGYLMMAERADRVVLSSRSVQADFENFAPCMADKARVLPFVAQLPADIFVNDSRWVCDYYHLPERYFFLPNQFWKHKNHQVVIQALSILQSRSPDIKVVCTGNTHDYRTPSYFPELLATISQLGVRDSLILLGMVPHNHVFQLIRQSLAVIQPSLFEGWSTTVEETKSIGKHMILSDIGVHREQAPQQALFFDPRNPQALADCLKKMFNETQPGPNVELEALAREQLPQRTIDFGMKFVEIVREVVPV